MENMGTGLVAKEDMITQEEYMDMYLAVGMAWYSLQLWRVKPAYRTLSLSSLRRPFRNAQ
jgi:hypothetical protein